MILEKTFNHTLDLSLNEYSQGESIVMNIDDKNIYKLVLNLLNEGTPLNTTGLILSFIPGVDTLTHVVVDPTGGQVSLEFNDLSSYNSNEVRSVLLKVVNGSKERFYKGFKMSFSKLP